MRKRRGGHEDGGGHDNNGSMRWLLTYADMITLLMAFFIMMYSMSVLNLSKFRQAAFSIRSGFAAESVGHGRTTFKSSGKSGTRPSILNGDTGGVPWEVIKPLQEFILKNPQLSKSARLFVDDRGLVISLKSDTVIFGSGSAGLISGAMPVLDKVATALKKVPNDVRIEGHTCDLTMRGDVYSSNWELSTARATNVVRYFVENQQVPSKRLSAAGYAGWKPLVPNDSLRHRQMNRRVDIVIFRMSG